MKDDPILTEIRRIRHELSGRFKHYPKQFVKFFQEQERQHPERMIYFRCPPTEHEQSSLSLTAHSSRTIDD